MHFSTNKDRDKEIYVGKQGFQMFYSFNINGKYKLLLHNSFFKVFSPPTFEVISLVVSKFSNS